MLAEFNINNHVRVRLTDHGRMILRQNGHRFECITGTPYALPKADEDGWTRWQLWELMSEFGSEMFNGCRMPFDALIEIELQDQVKAEP